METRAHHILIGLFVLLSGLGAMAFGLWLSQSRNGDDMRHYQIIFLESVRGLSVGSVVEYNGIAVGDVASLRLDPANPGHALARIRVHADTPMRQNTEAALAMQGLTGRSIIQLSGGTGESPALQSRQGEDPVIVARPSPVARILDQGEHTVANLNALILSAQQLLAPENIAHLRQTLAHLAQLSHTLAAQGEHVGDVLAAARSATQHISQTAQAVTALAQGLHTAVDAHAPRIVANLDHSAASLLSILRQADALLRESHAPLRSGLQGTSAIGPALRELRATLAALRTALERLNQDPAGYLLNRNPLQEFTP